MVRFYSTYEELKRKKYKKGTFKEGLVFTVPMRNWNKFKSSIDFYCINSFYSTYEELKL